MLPPAVCLSFVPPQGEHALAVNRNETCMERTVQVCQLEKLRGRRAPAFWAAASPSSRLLCTYRALATTEQVLGLPLTGRAPCASTARRGPGARQPESSGRCLSRGLGQLLSLAE